MNEFEVPDSRHSDAVARLCKATLEGPGHTDPELRYALAAYAGELWSSGGSDVTVPEKLRPYVRKVALASYKVVDEDVDALRETAGLSEDEILEVTLVSALGCALAALEIGTGSAQPG